MSQINDALKKAKKVQGNNPGPPPVTLPPAHARAQRRESDFSLPLLLGIAAVLVLGGALLSYAFLKGGSSPMTDKTATPVVAEKPVPVPAPAAPPAPTVKAAPVTSVAKAMQPVVEPPPVSPAPVPSLVVSTILTPTKSTLPVLQGIFYRADKPSAIVSGKTVVPGGHIGGFEVLAITPTTVTLGNDSETNVLKLPE